MLEVELLKKKMYSLGNLIDVSNVHRFRERFNQYKRYRACSLYCCNLSPLKLCCLFTADWKAPLHLNQQPTHWSSHVKVRCHLQKNFRGFHHPSPPLQEIASRCFKQKENYSSFQPRALDPKYHNLEVWILVLPVLG